MLIPLMNKRKNIIKGYALVDEDQKALLRFNWMQDANGYALRYDLYLHKNVYMHRQIMQAPEEFFVDHINHKTNDNRRENLRLVTNKENQWNQVDRPGKYSKYRGVSKYKNGKYTSFLKEGNKLLYLGSFNTPTSAALAYDIAALSHRGAYAKPNFPSSFLFFDYVGGF